MKISSFLQICKLLDQEKSNFRMPQDFISILQHKKRTLVHYFKMIIKLDIRLVNHCQLRMSLMMKDS